MTRHSLLVSLAAFAVLLGALWLGSAPLRAQSDKGIFIDEGLYQLDFTANGKRYTIRRNQDENHVLTGSFAKTSRPCPPFCVHPMAAAPGVTTVGELELLECIKNKLEPGSGLLIDARIESWYKKGTIPGGSTSRSPSSSATPPTRSLRPCCSGSGCGADGPMFTRPVNT